MPKDRFSTRTLRPLSLRCCTTQSMAAMTWDTSTDPSAAPTFTLRMRASGATPVKWAGSGTAESAVSRPAMSPAMWVPWP